MTLYEVDNVGYSGYDTYNAMIVWAESEEQARQVAADTAGDYNIENWRAAEVNDPGVAGVLLSSFNAG